MGGEIALAFAAGLLSFATPCVLPLVPGYLSVVAGLEADALAGGGPTVTRRVVGATIPFVIGFTIVFALAGAAAGAFGGAADAWRPILVKAAGILIVAMGFALMGLLPLPFLERLVAPAPGERARRSPVLLGAAFALCFAPCLGPVLASLLALASSQETAGKGAALLAVYSAGLALPFFAVGIAYGHAMGAFRWIRDRQSVVRAISGAVLVAIGLLLFFDRLWWLNVPINRALQSIGLDGLPRL
jgi:cytochrome c-type biogenesis protein